MNQINLTCYSERVELVDYQRKLVRRKMNIGYWNNALDHASQAGIKAYDAKDQFMKNFWYDIELKYYAIADRGI